MNARRFGSLVHWKVLSHSARLAMQNRQLKQAEHLYQSALAEALAFGEESVCVARGYWRLGRLAAYQKEFGAAEFYWLEALKTAIHLRKQRSSFVLRLYVHLAWNCLQQQEKGAAQIWRSRALRLLGRMTHTQTRCLSSLYLLRQMCRTQNRNQDAANVHRLIIRITRQETPIVMQVV
ncbi:MAG: hypothetical protein P9L94_11380 [Candidatus Hinthialibacter antarcticus]|nr:hypothetical protein [Candidatus Hinthialibacter antarcticus]